MSNGCQKVIDKLGSYQQIVDDFVQTEGSVDNIVHRIFESVSNPHTIAGSITKNGYMRLF